MSDTTVSTPDYSTQPVVSPEMFATDPQNITLSDIQVCLDYAKANNVTVAARGSYNLNSSLTIDSVKWNGGGFKGSGNIILINSSLNSVDIDGPWITVSGGLCEITHNKIYNQTSTAALFIGELVSTTRLICTYNEFYNANYSILQQGGGSETQQFYMDSGVISYNIFHDNAGDAIELNLVNRHYKNGMLIEGNNISNINGTKVNSNWGIGIGIAGSGPYALDLDDSNYASNFSVKNNYITGCRQGIHTELCRDFDITNNTCYPDTTKSTTTGIISGAYVSYGCKQFVVDGLNGEPSADSSRFMVIDWGNNNGTYASPPRDFTVKNVNTLDGNIEITTACGEDWTNTAIIESIRCNGIYWRGLPSVSVFRNIYCISLDCIGRHAAGEGSGGGVYTRLSYTYTHWVDVLCISADAQTNATVTKMNVDKLTAVGNNFPVYMATPAIPGHRGPLLVSSTEQYLLPDDTFPTGREFSEGTVLWKRSGGYYLVTTAGASITGNDIVAAADSGAITLQTANYDWTKEQHYKNAGTSLVIKGAGDMPDGGSVSDDLITTIIKGTYVSGGKYAIDINPPLITAINTTALQPLNVIQYVEVG